MTPLSDQAVFALVGVLFLPVWCPAVYWWTHFCIRRYRRWAK